MNKISTLLRVRFDSLFGTNNDGTLSPKTPMSIVGVAGTLDEQNIIRELKLSDETYIHNYTSSVAKVRMLGKETVIMGFA